MSDQTRAPGPWRTPRLSPFRLPGRLLARHRRAASALAAGLSVACAVSAVTPPPSPTVAVVVAARAVAAGSSLTDADLQVAHYPAGLGPADAIGDPGRAVGRPAVIALSPGSPVTTTTILTADTQRAVPGHALVPVRLSDPQFAQLLRVGDRVDVLALAEQGGVPRVVARAARVAAMPVSGGSGGPLGGVEDSRGPAILFDVETDSAPALAQAATQSRLGVVLR